MLTALRNAIQLLQDSVAQFIASLPAIVIAIIVFYVTYRLSDLAKMLVYKALRRARRTQNVQIVLSRLTRWTIILIGFLFSFMIAVPGFSPAELISLLGIGSVAIGFAFRDVLQNFLAGILILLTEPFKIGDQIIVSDYEGTVEDIQIRATFVRTYDNRRVVIPNGDLFTGSVTVNTAFDKRRSQYAVGIGYEDDIEAAQTLCLDILRDVEGVLHNPPPDTVMTEMGDSAVIFLVRWWTNPRQANLLKIQNLVLRRIKNDLTDAGFNIPFPIRTVYFNDETRRYPAEQQVVS